MDPCACQLTEIDKEYATTYLNEHDEVRQKAIDEIRQWISEKEKLHSRIDDFSIVRFLRTCKFDVNRTKKRMKNYYAQRGKLPEWYANRDPLLPELQELFHLGVFLPLRKLDDERRMVIIARTAIHDPYNHSIANVLKAGKMILDVATRNNETVSIHGVVAVFDMTGVTAGHGFQMTPSLIKRLVHSWHACYPLRIASINFVNAPVYVNVVLNIFRHFMTKKMRERLHVHTGNMADFFDTVPNCILPKEYGGTDGSLHTLIEPCQAFERCDIFPKFRSFLQDSDRTNQLILDFDVSFCSENTPFRIEYRNLECEAAKMLKLNIKKNPILNRELCGF